MNTGPQPASRRPPGGPQVRRALQAGLFSLALLHPLAQAQDDAVVASGPASAASAAATATLAPVTVRGRSEPSVGIAGFGDLPASRLPMQTRSIPLQGASVQRIADLVDRDASLGDAYNTEGYWDSLSIRGFLLDNRSNYRRDGLPISAETAIPLDNKERIEVLKGLSGQQAGISSPGGLVNQIVKRPDAPLRSATLAWRQDHSRLAALDLSERFGPEQALGLRVNAAYEDLQPRVRDASGHRHLLAAAADWRLAAGDKLEAEVEQSRRVQPSVPGFSLLGDELPAPANPRVNLNNQPWSQPMVFDATTASVRWTRPLGEQWRGSVHLVRQQLRTDDRIAFPYSCDAEQRYDRYCSDGRFDLYDYRSEGEQRRNDALEMAAEGRVRAAGLLHQVRGGVLLSRARVLLPPQAFNLVGTGRIDGSMVTTPDPSRDPNDTVRLQRESSTEAYLRGASVFSDGSQLWWGLRHTRLRRDPGQAEEATYRQGFTTPWLAYSRDLTGAWGEGWSAYVSWGQGIESAATPNLDIFRQRGAVLPALRSRQTEAGLQHDGALGRAALAWFDIQRPQTADVCEPTAPAPNCDRVNDGVQRHRGLDLSFETRPLAGTSLGASLTALHARREGSAAEPASNGAPPPNVPRQAWRAQIQHQPAPWPSLKLALLWRHDSERSVLPTPNSPQIPGWSRTDLRISQDTRIADQPVTWRAGIDNLTDRRAWRESPYQFGHVYLFPLAPRTLWLNLEFRG